MLLIEDIERMRIEFPDVFEELFMNSYRRLNKELEIKIEAIKLCETSNNTKKNTPVASKKSGTKLNDN